MKPDLRRRLSESVEAAAGLAAGLVEVDLVDRKPARGGRGSEAPSKSGPSGPSGSEHAVGTLFFSEQFACLNCGTSIPELEPRIFSFNSPHGACERCHGLGFQRVIDPELVVPDPTLSLEEGALQPWNRGVTAYWRRLIAAVADENGVDITKPWSKLKKSEREIFLNGTGRAAPSGHLHEPVRPSPLLPGPLRGDRQPAPATLRRDRLGDEPRADRELHGGAAVPGVRRRQAAAREPGGQGRRDQHRRVQRDVRDRRRRVDPRRSS